MADEPGIFEIMYNCRAMRRLKPDPVPEELLLKLVDAGNQGRQAQCPGCAWIIVREEQREGSLNSTRRPSRVRGPASGRAAALRTRCG